MDYLTGYLTLLCETRTGKWSRLYIEQEKKKETGDLWRNKYSAVVSVEEICARRDEAVFCAKLEQENLNAEKIVVRAIGRCAVQALSEQREELQICWVIGRDWYVQTRSKCQREPREQETSYVSREETFMSLSGAYSPSHKSGTFIAVVYAHTCH